MRNVRLRARHGPHSSDAALLLRARACLRVSCPPTRCVLAALRLQPGISGAPGGHLRAGADNGADDARRVRSV